MAKKKPVPEPPKAPYVDTRTRHDANSLDRATDQLATMRYVSTHDAKDDKTPFQRHMRTIMMNEPIRFQELLLKAEAEHASSGRRQSVRKNKKLRRRTEIDPGEARARQVIDKLIRTALENVTK